jgi:inorganic pyrophosphatase
VPSARQPEELRVEPPPVDRDSIFDRVPTGPNVPWTVNAVIEIPKGRRSKFEADKATGLVKLDRYLYSSSHYPGDYGFIPQTLAEDGDPLDILVMVNEPTFSGCLIEARVLGMFRMTDRGDNDYKILGVPDSDPLFAEFHTIRDVPKHYLREVEHFFGTYKQLEGGEIRCQGWASVEPAVAEVDAAVSRYVFAKKKAGGSTQDRG